MSPGFVPSDSLSTSPVLPEKFSKILSFWPVKVDIIIDDAIGARGRGRGGITFSFPQPYDFVFLFCSRQRPVGPELGQREDMYAESPTITFASSMVEILLNRRSQSSSIQTLQKLGVTTFRIRQSSFVGRYVVRLVAENLTKVMSGATRLAQSRSRRKNTIVAG